MVSSYGRHFRAPGNQPVPRTAAHLLTDPRADRLRMQLEVIEVWILLAHPCNRVWIGLLTGDLSIATIQFSGINAAVLSGAVTGSAASFGSRKDILVPLLCPCYLILIVEDRQEG